MTDFRDPEHTLTGRVLAHVETMPGVDLTADDLMSAFPDLERKQIAGVLTRSLKLGRLEPAGRGRYRYDPTASPQPAAAARATETPAELRPITDAVDDEAFKAAGLIPIATTIGGDRICIDDQGIPWRVTISVQARLL